jgi:TPR repeat protein
VPSRWDGKGESIDFERTAHYFQLAADQGNPVAQFNHGTFLRDTAERLPDLPKASHYLKLSADQGNSDGQFHSGVSLFYGLRLPMDLRGAAGYFKLSADEGDADAQGKLPRMRTFSDPERVKALFDVPGDKNP